MVSKPKKPKKPRVRRPKKPMDTGPKTWSSKVTLTAANRVTPYTGISTTSFSRNSYDKTRTSVRNPKWKEQVANGQQAGTPFTASGVERTVFEDGFTSVTLKLGTVDKPEYYSESYAGSLGYSVVAPNHLSGRLTTADNQALKSVYSAIKQQQQHFSGGTFLGEFREALHMIKRPASALRDGISKYNGILTKRMNGAISRGQSRKQRKKALLDAASGSWLEASFGWLPLLSDIKGIAETAARFQYDFRHSEVRGFGIDRKVATYPNEDLHIANYLNGHVIQRDEWNQIVVYRCGVSFANTSDFGSIGRLAELSGFNLSDFAPTVWELTPWSFLVDYFTNVGDVISAYSTGNSAVKWTNKSDVLRTTRTVMCVASLDDMKRQLGSSISKIVGFNSGGFGSSKVVRKDVIRSQPSSLPMPTLEFSLPGSSFKWANVVALGIQNHRKLLNLFHF